MTPAEVREKAYEIAEALRRRGYPVVGADAVDGGAKAAFAITRADGRPWAFRVPPELLEMERVAHMVETYL